MHHFLYENFGIKGHSKFRYFPKKCIHLEINSQNEYGKQKSKIYISIGPNKVQNVYFLSPIAL